MKILETWRGFPPNDKFKIILTLVGLCLSAVAVTYLISRPGSPIWKKTHEGSYYESKTMLYTKEHSVEKYCVVTSTTDVHPEDMKLCD